MSENPTAMPPRRPGVWELVFKSAVIHTLTYFLMGLFALVVFDYATQFASGPLSAFMRPTDDPVVATGPLYQPLRGALFGAVFWLLRDALFTRPLVWLAMWAMLAVVGIVNPFGPAPGSIEGMIYMSMPLSAHFGLGLIEVFAQSLLLAAGVFFWVRRPDVRWYGWLVTAAAIAALLLSASALFFFPAPGAAA